MANETVNHRNENELALESAKHISVLLNWIERARELSDTFDHLFMYDDGFKARCKENHWFPVAWDESESQALTDLVSIQEGLIRKVRL